MATLVKWILFAPVTLIAMGLVQAIAVTVGESGPWWIWFFVYASFGWLASSAIVYSCACICPNKKAGSYMLLGVFIVAELFYLGKSGFGSTALEIILRAGVDVGIIGELLAAADSEQRGKA